MPSYGRFSGRRRHICRGRAPIPRPEERDPEDPAHQGARQQAAEEHTGEARSGMVGDGCDKNPENDRHGPLKAGREHHRQDLCLVADLCETNDYGRNQKRFHGCAIGPGGGEPWQQLPPPDRMREPMPKVSPTLRTPAPWPKPSMLTQAPRRSRAATPQWTANHLAQLR